MDNFHVSIYFLISDFVAVILYTMVVVIKTNNITHIRDELLLLLAYRTYNVNYRSLGPNLWHFFVLCFFLQNLGENKIEEKYKITTGPYHTPWHSLLNLLIYFLFKYKLYFICFNSMLINLWNILFVHNQGVSDILKSNFTCILIQLILFLFLLVLLVLTFQEDQIHIK